MAGVTSCAYALYPWLVCASPSQVFTSIVSLSPSICPTGVHDDDDDGDDGDGEDVNAGGVGDVSYPDLPPPNPQVGSGCEISGDDADDENKE